MRRYADTYGIAVMPPDWHKDMADWKARQTELTHQVAGRLLEPLGMNLNSYYGERYEGTCFSGRDASGNAAEVWPNYSPQEDWEQPEHKDFQLILLTLSSDLDRLKALERRFTSIANPRLVLLKRTTYIKGAGQPSDVLFVLPPTTPEGNEAENTLSENDMAD